MTNRNVDSSPSLVLRARGAFDGLDPATAEAITDRVRRAIRDIAFAHDRDHRARAARGR